MKSSELNQERRKQDALEKLGSSEPRCTHCGEDNWRCLEQHHIAGRVYDESCVILCRNCHRMLSDAQRDHPAPLFDGMPTPFERIGHFLLGLADLLRLLVDKLTEFGLALVARQEKANPNHE